jgi:hypothetical protein
LRLPLLNVRAADDVCGFGGVVSGETRLMMNRDARLEENQHVFRSANERLSGVVEAGVVSADPVPFLCECADEECMGRVDLTLDEYRELRSHERQFVMVHGHARTEGEEVVAERNGYDITKKPS